MNTRDPFNLRKGSTALSLLQNTATRAATSLATSTLQTGQQALEAGRQVLDDGMSFAVPRNVPSFDSSQRRLEDSVWGSSGRSRFGENGNIGGGVAEKVAGIFNDGKGLPMYKDKPYNYGASIRRKRWFRRKRTWGILGLLIFSCFYWLGWLGGGVEERPTGKQSGGTWGGILSGSKSSKKIDWEDRKERVKDAFKLSWSAYEKHGWGKLSSDMRFTTSEF